MSPTRLVLLQLVLGAALSACGVAPQPAPIQVPPAPTQGVQGTVVIGVGAEALAGAQIEALDAGGHIVAQTRTGLNGQYTLGLPAGTYTILSPGQVLNTTVNQGGAGPVPFASSQVSGVEVLNSAFTGLNLVQLPAAAGSNASTPPVVKVDNLGSSYDVSGTVSFNDDVSTGGGNSLTYLAASFGRDPVLFRLGRNNRDVLFIGGQAGETQPSLHVQQQEHIDLKRYAAGLSGDTRLYLTAVDSNNNRSVSSYPLTLTGAPDGASLGNTGGNSTVQGVDLTAYTVANTRIQSLSAPSGAGGALVYASLTWTPYTFPAVSSGALNQGYHVYRSLNGGPETRVATLGLYTTTNASGKTVLVNPSAWQDTDPALAPGVRASYTVRAFSGRFETPDSASSAATVLPALSVHLTGPAEQAGGVSTTPTFSWSTNGVGAAEYFVPVLSDTVNGAGTSGCGVLPVAQPGSDLITLLQQATLSSARGFGFASTLCGVVGGPASSTYSFAYRPGADVNAPVFPLQEGRSYQWRLLEAVAVDDPQAPHAASVAFDGAGLLFHFNLYGGLYTFDGDQVFTFTTGGSQ